MAGIDPRYYYLTLGLLLLCTVVGLIVAYRFQRDVTVDDLPPTEKEVLGPLEKAYYSGLMNEDEFQRIQQSMAKQKDVPAVVTKPSKVMLVKTEPPGISVSTPSVEPVTGSGMEPETETSGSATPEMETEGNPPV